MAHGYRTLQHWDQWLASQELGRQLLAIQQQALSACLKKHIGKHALLIGVPNQKKLFNASMMPCQTILSPLVSKHTEINVIDGDLKELPIASGSVDLVMLPHTLEFLENPQRLLNEACRIVKPEGLIVIIGFNPYSLWGARKAISKQNEAPWSENFIHSAKVKKWLELAEFHLEQEKCLMFRPPLKKINIFEKLDFLESFGKYVLPSFGGVYLLVARAIVIPLTPIRLKWKQRLSNIRISSSEAGYIAREHKTLR